MHYCEFGWVLIGNKCHTVPGWVLVLLGWAVALGTQEYRAWRARVRRRKQLAKIRDQLEKIADWRSKGMAIRNDGSRLRNAAQEAAWYCRVRNWQGKALKAVERLSPVDAARIRTLDIVVALPPGPCAIRNPNHRLELRMRTQETALLNELILYWGPT